MKRASPSPRRILRCFLLTSSLYLSLSAAQASDKPVLANLIFTEIDRNHDGAIDAREAAPIPELAAVFNTLDKNKDGLLSEQEFKAASQPIG